MERSRDNKKYAGDNMNISPFRFGQTDKLPVNPVGYPALGHDIEYQSGDRHYQKAEQRKKRCQAPLMNPFSRHISLAFYLEKLTSCACRFSINL